MEFWRETGQGRLFLAVFQEWAHSNTTLLEEMMKVTKKVSVAVLTIAIAIAICVTPSVAQKAGASFKPFNVVEATIPEIHAAMKAGTLTAHQLIQDYLDRIAAYDKNGPDLNCIIILNSEAPAEANK